MFKYVKLGNMENYEQKYNKLVEAIKILQETNPSDEGIQNWLNDNVPELRKSEDEDEKIRKELITHFRNTRCVTEEGAETMIKWISWLEKQGELEDKGEISDGYHTFNELYRYRLLYNAAFFNLLPKEIVHKSKKHHDGEECFGGGWFIVMANLPTGQISNHYELKDWDLFQIPEKDVADEWDGHTPQEAAERLHKYLLEKQGEQKKVSIWKHWENGIAGNGEGKQIYLIRMGNTYNLSSCLGFECDYIELSDLDNLMLEEQGEQKPVDKVKPKFHPGDWVILNNTVAQILDKQKYGFVGIDINGEDFFCNYGHTDSMRLWTIQDAKDGDVLYSLDSKQPFIYKERPQFSQARGYCCINTFGEFAVWNTIKCHICTDKYIPATKEQSDLLFQTMKEAGYEWDSEKKELKKIETKTLDTNQSKKQDKQKSTDVEQKSYEDEDGIYLCFADGYKTLFRPVTVVTTKHGPVTHIGIKVGEHKVGLKLNSLGEQKLPFISSPYKYNRDLDSDDFDYKYQELYALDDYEGKENTDHLKRLGEFKFRLDNDEWIPALGELAIIYKNKDKLNDALAVVGGDKLEECWYWSSTEYGAHGAWFVHFSRGGVGVTGKFVSYVVRSVCAF